MNKKSILKQYIGRYKWSYLIGIITLLVVDYVQMFVPQVIGHITDGIRDGSMASEGILTLVVGLIGIVIVLAIGRICWRYFIIGTARKIEKGIRKNLFEKWVGLDVPYFNQNKTGNLMAYATNDLNAIRMMVGNGVVIIFDAVIMTVMVIVQMALFVDIKLTLIAIIPMPLIALSTYYFGKRIRARFDKKQQAFAKLSDKVQESFSGIKVIKSFVQEYYDMKDFEAISKDNYHKNLHLTRLSAVLNPLMTLLVGCSLLISIGYGGYLTMINTITLGEFVAFNQYIMMLSWPMMAIAMGINVFAQGSASLKRIQGVLDEVPSVQDEANAKELQKVEGHIRIDNLSFDFPDNHQTALENISIEVEAGQTLAVLGRTGSGKSTLVNLLLRLYNSPEGSIMLDGQDIMKATLQSVRRNIAYVPQDNFLFSDTVGKNIAFGMDEVSDEQIKAAAEKANVHNNIVDFPLQYETVVGERGTTLSGGQKQRVSIARALILDAPVLILDDSLSAVDTKTEEKILGNLRTVRQGKTNIIIAHRISTVRHADKIVVLENGKIVEVGNHETLLAKEGIYAEMNNQQKLEEAIHEA
ncbi:MAG: ABC transporter ATP-binding protein [Cellulosilyticaceae bacterium]